ncbi:MAG: CRISPR-associated helicase Cas3' [Eubacteriales bacterium]|nr:CRISPR-associated helicase Cas3' [Eubacteriales bacterium]
MQNRTQRNGLFFALPTQATTNAAFPRILSWMERLMPFDRYAVRLAHGKAQFNDEYVNLPSASGICEDSSEDGAIVNSWFEGGKKALLADYVVGTIDQLLLMALKQKHVMLRHFGLADKVVVIDECHAFDSYMGQYLYMALRWLGAYKTPVIIMSATLPPQKRREMIAAYMGKSTASNLPLSDANAYPLITCVCDEQIQQYAVECKDDQKIISIEALTDENIATYLDTKLTQGGCVGVIVNTVKKAQQLYLQLADKYGADVVRLAHSRFLIGDRVSNERELIRELGKESEHRPQLRIVVGTQVLEQSLDVDFDLMISELCPMDLLLQRIGRLHRHNRSRPAQLDKPICAVLCLDETNKGSASIYGDCLLMRTKALLPNRIVLPTDIPKLVAKTYDFAFEPEGLPEEYAHALDKHNTNERIRQRKASSFRLAKPSIWATRTLNDWFNIDVPYSEQRSYAAVRDGDESVEVVVLIRHEQGLGFLPWCEGGQIPEAFDELPPQVAKAMARQTIALPTPLCKAHSVENTLKELESLKDEIPKAWKKSTWLTDQLFLVLDEELKTTLNGYCITYDRLIGMTYMKEDSQ